MLRHRPNERGAHSLSPLAWILVTGFVMSGIALVGSLTLLLSRETLDRILLPLVALAAGTLLGGAFFHVLPASVEAIDSRVAPFAWCVVGFAIFLATEQALHWHHDHHGHDQSTSPRSSLVLLADTLHNLLGGLAVGGAFLVDVRVGLVTWAIAAAHEVPQELGDFGVLVHSGWSARRALLWNVASALTFPLGGLIAWAASHVIDVAFLLPIAAGNFIYVAAVDLVPEIHHHSRSRQGLLLFACFALGLGIVGGATLLGGAGGHAAGGH